MEGKINGESVFSHAQTEKIIAKRNEIVIAYCAAKGWDATKLTVVQLMEVRSQEDWKAVPEKVLAGEL